MDIEGEGFWKEISVVIGSFMEWREWSYCKGVLGERSGA